MTDEHDTPTCEYLIRFDRTAPTFCGKVAVSRYPAMGGGFMPLCIEHGKPHAKYTEPCYAGESQ